MPEESTLIFGGIQIPLKHTEGPAEVRLCGRNKLSLISHFDNNLRQMDINRYYPICTAQ